MNAILAENRRRGTRDWALTQPATAREIEGFASATSINRGESIELFVNTQSPTFVLEVFRMGWYQGLGSRRVLGPQVVKGVAQVVPAPDADTGLVDCAWINPFCLQTTAGDVSPDWVSGVYLVKLTASDSGAQSYIIFVVRDDSQRAGLLFQLSIATYQAYNYWGDKSLYNWGSSAGKRAAISLV